MEMFTSHALSSITNRRKMTARRDWSSNMHVATLRAIGDTPAQLTFPRLPRPRLKHWTHCILRPRDTLSLLASIKATSSMQTTWAFSMPVGVSATARKNSECPGKSESPNIDLLSEFLYARRHLFRLWLRDPEFEWEKHVALKERFDRVYADLKTENPVFLLEAIIRGADVGTWGMALLVMSQ